MKAPSTSSAAWAERYETLRRYVLEGRQRLETQPLGLALWVAKGMAGWMRQWMEVTQGAPPPPRPAVLPGGRLNRGQPQLTILLAQMTLDSLQLQSSV